VQYDADPFNQEDDTDIFTYDGLEPLTLQPGEAVQLESFHSEVAPQDDEFFVTEMRKAVSPTVIEAANARVVPDPLP